MWRNGRRNGLKIRYREKRGMGSNPIIGTSENAILLGKFVRIRDLVDCEQSRTETHKTPSSRQLFVKWSTAGSRFQRPIIKTALAKNASNDAIRENGANALILNEIARWRVSHTHHVSVILRRLPPYAFSLSLARGISSNRS